MRSHHGYFGSWIAMTAARLLNVGFSMTLHGSDLLLNGTYLDVKLSNCTFCLTVSEYNRAYINKRFPDLDPAWRRSTRKLRTSGREIKQVSAVAGCWTPASGEELHFSPESL
jgi:hypothetical protein